MLDCAIIEIEFKEWMKIKLTENDWKSTWLLSCYSLFHIVFDPNSRSNECAAHTMRAAASQMGNATEAQTRIHTVFAAKLRFCICVH